jgi:hypothetical protein
MGVFPSNYLKTDFQQFLINYKVSSEVIDNFNKFPEELIYNNSIFELRIIVTWFSIGYGFYNFELNYYSDDLTGYLIKYEIFDRAELSIDYLLQGLINLNLIKE